MSLLSSLAVSPTDILDDLRRRQFSVTVQGGQLLIRPAGRLQPDDREHIAANRDELVSLLAEPVGYEADGVCRGDISKSARTTDPRPDIVSDSAAWQQLLVIAAEELGVFDELFGVLLGLRACGVGLQRAQDGSWRITAGEMDADEYAVDREPWLMPRKREVAHLLRRLASEVSE